MEFKAGQAHNLFHLQQRINRIRLEFKVSSASFWFVTLFRINRIRLEFKVSNAHKQIMFIGVLIESDWNLKDMEDIDIRRFGNVLIESDWNLKSQ